MNKAPVTMVGGFSRGDDPLRDKNDFYETPQGFTDELLLREKFYQKIWEPAAGKGAITNLLEYHGYDVYSSDIDPQKTFIHQEDFLTSDRKGFDIVTNPPFKMMIDFANHAFDLCHQKVAMVGPLSAITSKGRYNAIWNKLPVSKIYLAPMPQHIQSNRGIIKSQFCHLWFIIDKGHMGPAIIEWFPDIVYKGKEI